ncbi:large ribosomal subunit protein bL28m [Helicoverpa armigera]|uniref:39S ribosomal protein L28, mitochondrial n=1 Tax=Heliothis virescens TaxID=7102 RepID=A0A2A4J6F8_HELVI|nr:39S ribosomal protein L28, mitochondrial isoform X2 [Helicoverpa armigera]XP_047023358.1 39S ribosomal protein L28, mitochondrial [Helicoverpa zea]
MASRIQATARQLSKTFKRKSRFDIGIASELPVAYKKFWREWKILKPAAVHYIPQEGKWKRDDLTGEILPIQNVPLPLKYPAEINEGLWGGEAVVKGFQKRDPRRRRVPHYWVPVLKRTVVKSEILNTHLSVTVTDRTISLINDHYGFDHYLLKTPACDLVSMLALKLKKQILIELMNGCPRYAHDPQRQKEVYEEYKTYLSSYTPEEIEWYGLSWYEALCKLAKQKEAANKPVPLKNMYRKNLVEKLKAAGIDSTKTSPEEISNTTSWLSKMNPFGKKDEA